MTRIWHQSVNELDDLAVYKRALETHAAEVLGGTAQVIVHGMPSGTYDGLSATHVLGNAYAYHRALHRKRHLASNHFYRWEELEAAIEELRGILEELGEEVEA